MTDDEATDPRPGRIARGEARAAERKRRLSRALRDNLARRKAQARAREEAAPGNGLRTPRDDGD